MPALCVDSLIASVFALPVEHLACGPLHHLQLGEEPIPIRARHAAHAHQRLERRVVEADEDHGAHARSDDPLRLEIELDRLDVLGPNLKRVLILVLLAGRPGQIDIDAEPREVVVCLVIAFLLRLARFDPGGGLG
jgi:hypothetical protein